MPAQHLILQCFCNHFIVAHSLSTFAILQVFAARGLQKTFSVHSGGTGRVLNKAMQRILMAIIGHGRWQTVR